MADTEHTSDSFVFKTDRPWPNARLKVAAIVGHTTSSSVRLWLRTGQLGKFSLLLYPFETVIKSTGSEKFLKSKLATVPLTLNEVKGSLNIVQEIEVPIEDYDRDTTFVADVNQLNANTRYGYALYDKERQIVMLGHNRLRQFRTPPDEEKCEPFQFALFSCHMPYKVNGLFKKRTEVAKLEMWDFLNASLERHRDSIDLVIAGGDQCYSDGVKTLDIWYFLNRAMRKEGDHLLPDKEAMRSWYRDIYRGYWGFESVQRVFERFPTYMIWDDHEIGDGWGSHYFQTNNSQDGLHRLLPDLDHKKLTYHEGRELIDRMFQAAKDVYFEYQHSHNPPTIPDVWDYSFSRGGCEFYVLDGRGHRNIESANFRILGRKQFDRFADWVNTLDSNKTKFVFVVSAVPVLHTRASIVNIDEFAGKLGDDLRDSWEHELHQAEREAFMKLLFEVAANGINVAVLSGDVHVSAVYSIENESGNRIYQLTSSAITYGLSLHQSWILRMGAADDGETDEGYFFRRLALYTKSSYALISVDPKSGESWFKLYGLQELKTPDNVTEESVPLNNSLAKIRLH